MILPLLIIFGGVFTSPIGSSVDQPRLRVSVDRQSARILDPLEVRVEVTAAVGASVRFPEQNQRWGEFEIVSQTDRIAVPVDGADRQRTWTRQWQLETLKTGSVQIPTIEIEVIEPNQDPVRLRTDRITLEIISVVGQDATTQDIRDIRDVVGAAVESRGNRWLWPMIVLTVGTGLSLGGIFFWRYRNRPGIRPGRWALMQLSDPQSDSIDRMEKTVRIYIENEFGFPATSYSPIEIKQSLLQCHVDGRQAETLAGFLARADEIRFSGRDLDAAAQLEPIRLELRRTIQQLMASRGGRG